jgi:hypothetical protein
MRPRVPLIVVGLSMTLLLGSVAGAEASPNRGPTPAGGRIIWNANRIVCLESGGTEVGMRGHGFIEETGQSAVTWMRITVQFQRQVNGLWYTTKSRYWQNSVQFPDNSNAHWLNFTPTFHNHGADYTHWTRLRFVFQWYYGNTLQYRRSRVSGRC